VTARGQASVAWTARPGVVARTVAAHSLIMLAAVGPPLLVAALEGAIDLALALVPAVVLCLAGALVAHYRPRIDNVRQIEAVAAFVALFLLVSVFAAPGFLALGMTPLDALFESVSGVTSTGLTVAEATMDWPIAGHFLRAWLQWTGGFAIAVAGVALILGPGAASHEMGEVGINGRDLVASTRAQARQLLAAYCVITLIAIAILAALLPSWWEGVVVALSAASTGGFTPRADSLASYSPLAQSAVMAVCVATTVSLYAYVVARQSGVRRALSSSNAGAVLVALGSGTALVALAAAALNGWETEGVLDTALNFLSGFTTAGFAVAPIAQADALVALILFAMVVGGGIGSTAGGIKLDRVMTLGGMVGLSLLRLRSPRRSVTRLESNGKTVAADRVISIAAILALYTLTGLIGWLLFLTAGLAPLASVFDIVSALSTVGLSTGVVGPDLPAHLKAYLIVAMLAGRLEFLALLAVILPATWKRRA